MQLARATQAEFLQRIRALTPESPRGWGSLTPAGVLRHMRASIGASLGEVTVPDKSTVLSRTVIRWLVFHVLPWPKGRIKGPPELTPEPEEFESEREGLIRDIDRFLEAAEREPERRELHPFFGRQPLSYWRKMHGQHFDHHLRQFGV